MTDESPTGQSTDALSVEGITAGYDGPPILDRVSVAVKRGEMTAILGPNGAGKSTLAKAIIGQIRVTTGSVHLLGEEVTGMRAHRLVRRGFAYMPQLMSIFDDMSVVENLEMGGYTIGRAVRQQVAKVLELFPDLAEDTRKRAGALSGGQQRMLALARALMTDPSVVLLDEPTAGLSPLYAERVWGQMLAIRALGVGLLVIEQNAEAALEHADTVYLLAAGRNVLSGKVEDVRAHEDVAAILVG
jgi:branched-chain amino acid transport system ATP-binding protein